MTAVEPSQPGARRAASPAILPGMPFAVVLYKDEQGPCVLIRRPDDGSMPASPEASVRVVATTDDHGEAVAVAELVERAIRSGELR